MRLLDGVKIKANSRNRMANDLLYGKEFLCPWFSVIGYAQALA